MTSPPSPASSRFTDRFRLFACSLVLMAVAFSQRPGQLVGDTKLDLVVDPAGMLARSLHLWDPQGGFGQVQNQAYGYLFPMGPFFWLGDALTMPGWVVQRLWWSLLLVVAFLGAVKLCSAMRLGTPTSRIVAGFAYALSPRILTLLGPISVEAWPSALAPWVLVPLVLGARAGSARRAALMSALAVAATGGVNAAATFAVIPLGVLWLLTREPGPRRRSLMSWWPLFVLLGTAWWLVPLLLLGRYSPPFLDYIETASVTTVPTTLFDALRGTSHWVPYVDPTWQAGNDLVSTSHLALNSGVLLLFGIVGMTIRRNPHRQFLVLATFLGLLMVTAGHGGALEGWFGGLERQALDGVLAPLRNVHKFDLVIRLPLVLGLAHLLAVMGDRAADTAQGADVRRPRAYNVTGDRVAHVGVLMLCVVSVAGAASPALTGRLGPGQRLRGGAELLVAYGGLAGPELARHHGTAGARLQLRLLRVGGSRRRAPAAPGVLGVGGAQRGSSRARGQHPDARRHRESAGLRTAFSRSCRVPSSRGHRASRGPQRSPVGWPTGTSSRPPGARRLTRESGE